MMENAKWNSLEQSLRRKIGNKSNTIFLEELRRLVTPERTLRFAGVVISTTSPFNVSIWSVQKTDGPWRVRVDCHRLNQVVTPIAAAMTDVV